MSTIEHFDKLINRCLDIFLKKNTDYGASWRVMRPASLTDQILIKITRLRSIDEKQSQKVEDTIDDEFMGIINYAIMALIQLEEEWSPDQLESAERLNDLYSTQIKKVRNLLDNKNHDYAEAWRMMRLSSIIDIVLMKVYRTKNIEQNHGKTLVSEGIAANYQDMINYSIFALIKIQESTS